MFPLIENNPRANKDNVIPKIKDFWNFQIIFTDFLPDSLQFSA